MIAALLFLPCSSTPHAVQDLSEQHSFLTVESSAYVENPAMDALAENGFDVLRETRKCVHNNLYVSNVNAVWGYYIQ